MEDETIGKFISKTWEYIHDLLNTAINKNDKESQKSLGLVAAFMRKNASEEIKSHFMIKKIYK